MIRPTAILRLLATTSSLGLISCDASAQTKRFPADSVVQAIVNAYDIFESGRSAPDVQGRSRAASEEA